jgi:hypothetical protein
VLKMNAECRGPASRFVRLAGIRNQAPAVIHLSQTRLHEEGVGRGHRRLRRSKPGKDSREKLMASCGHRRSTHQYMPLADSHTKATGGRTCQWRGAVLGDQAGPRAPRGGLWPLASGRSASLVSVL